MTAALLAMIALPLLMALLLLWETARGLIFRSLGFAPMPALLLLPGSEVSVTLPGGWTFVLDQAADMMLGASAMLWICGGFAASHWLAGRPGQARFALSWLLTLSGSLGVFVAGDVVSFYALYALASLPAYGLIAFAGDEAARRAGRVTIAAALLGEALILAALVLLAASAPGQGLAIAPLMAALPGSPHCGLVIALVVIGFGLKIGLVPLHGWMPVSYASGPLAATAVLSGATSKAGIIGLIRFLPLDTAMPVAGGLVLAAGLVSAFYGAALGLTQTNPRTVLAYSSISQLGQMMAVLGAGLAAGVPGAGLIVAYYAVYHVLTKGGLFLMLGSTEEGRIMPKWQHLLAGFSALGFAGLPLTGGALGKLAFKSVVGSGGAAFMFSLAAVGSTLLMLHFIKLIRQPKLQAAAVSRAGWIWFTPLIAATLLQWGQFTAVTGEAASYAVSPSALWELSWPVAAGILLAGGLAAMRTSLPRIPPGDISMIAADVVERRSSQLAGLATRFEAHARQWQASSMALLTALVLFVALLAWGAKR